MKNSAAERNNNRRDFIKAGLKIAVVTSVAGAGLLSGCAKDDADAGQTISPTEDLMQEHGALRRILMIYDYCIMQLTNDQVFQRLAISESAGIIRSFVEDYHEKQEEDYLFQLMLKTNRMSELVQILSVQHKVGRTITNQIMQICKKASLSTSENNQLIELLKGFNKMYHPHAAWEDTVLFPEFRKIVSNKEYNSLGEEFEENELKLFGENGFKHVIDKIAGIEKELGIYGLAQFTPN